MKKYMKYILLIICFLIVYVGAGKVLDKFYLDKFVIHDYTGDSRFTTVNMVVDKRFKKSDTAVLVNTEYIGEVASTALYAYDMNVPVFYTEKNRVVPDVYKELEKLGVKKVIIIGGINSIGDSSQRSLERNGYKTERLIAARGIDISLLLAEKINEMKKISEIAVVTPNEFDLPNAVSFSARSQEKNIPIIVMDNEEYDILKLQGFIEKNHIKRVYMLSNDDYFNTNIEKTLPDVKKIGGEDRYEVNHNMINELYKDKNNKKIYISKGGELMHKRHIASGQLINAMAISPLAADNKAPIMYIKENYLSADEDRFIKEKGYKEINQSGFKIERRKFFNVDRFKNPTTVAIIFLSLWIAVLAIRRK